MSTVITPALVRRYLKATGATAADLVNFEARLARWDLDEAIDDGFLDRACLGMLAAAEMAHERATMAKCDRPERAVGHEMYALERSLVEAAGVDPIAWEKARGV